MTPPSSTLPSTGPKLSSQLCTRVVLSTKESHGTEETEPKREAVGAAGGRAGKKTCPRSLEFRLFHHEPQMPGRKLQDLVCAILGFSLALV